MTIKDFKVASFDKQCEWIIKRTDYLAARDTVDGKVYLYHTANFFIEVSYSHALKRVTSIDVFNEIEKLLVYTEEVSLDDLDTH